MVSSEKIKTSGCVIPAFAHYCPVKIYFVSSKHTYDMRLPIIRKNEDLKTKNIQLQS